MFSFSSSWVFWLISQCSGLTPDSVLRIMAGDAWGTLCSARDWILAPCLHSALLVLCLTTCFCFVLFFHSCLVFLQSPHAPMVVGEIPLSIWVRVAGNEITDSRWRSAASKASLQLQNILPVLLRNNWVTSLYKFPHKDLIYIKHHPKLSHDFHISLGQYPSPQTHKKEKRSISPCTNWGSVFCSVLTYLAL